MGRRIAVVALWMAVVASALAVPAPAPTKEEHSQHEPPAAVQQKGECDDALLFSGASNLVLTIVIMTSNAPLDLELVYANNMDKTLICFRCRAFFYITRLPWETNIYASLFFLSLALFCVEICTQYSMSCASSTKILAR